MGKLPGFVLALLFLCTAIGMATDKTYVLGLPFLVLDKLVDFMQGSEPSTNPALQGNWAPFPSEVALKMNVVEGTIPTDLSGIFVR